LQGGNFWEGAAIGLTVGLLNHAGKKLFDAIHRNSFTRVYDKNGNYIGKIKVVNYKASHKTDGTSGVEIDLEFKAVRNSGYRNFRWVQTVRTDSPRGGTTQTKNLRKSDATALTAPNEKGAEKNKINTYLLSTPSPPRREGRGWEYFSYEKNTFITYVFYCALCFCAEFSRHPRQTRN
jgi:hypothetical protein